MKRNSDGKIAVYLLFLVLGIGFGLIAGGEFMRRLSNGQFNNLFGAKSHSSDTLINTIPVQSSDTVQYTKGVQENILDTRRNAIVNATRKVAPCVVGIVVTQIQVVKNNYQTNDFFDFFFGPELMPRYREVERWDPVYYQ